MIRRPAAAGPSARPLPVPRDPQRGTGLVGSVFGVAAFLAFLMLAVQLLTNLYATSVVTAVGYDAARSVAAAPVGRSGSSSVADAEAAARASLAGAGRGVRFDWTGTDADTVRLHIHLDNPRLLGMGVGDVAFTHIDRTIVVRRERFRSAVA